MKCLICFLILGSIFGCSGDKNRSPEQCEENHDTAISCIQQIDTTTLSEDIFKEALQQCLSKTRIRNRDGRKGDGKQRGEHENEGDRKQERRRPSAEDRQRNNNCSNKNSKEEQVECFIKLFQTRKQERCKAQ